MATTSLMTLTKESSKRPAPTICSERGPKIPTKTTTGFGGGSEKDPLSVSPNATFLAFEAILVSAVVSVSKNTLHFDSTARTFPPDALVKNAHCTRPDDYFSDCAPSLDFALQSPLRAGQSQSARAADSVIEGQQGILFGK